MHVRLFAFLPILAVLNGGALAQQTPLSPYTGFETRQIKALSANQIEDLKAGRGMMLALAAELNGYPGPVHALELADQLGLSENQRSRMQELYAAMKTETIPLGEQLIEQEKDLDAQFAKHAVTRTSLIATMKIIGETQAALRTAHLKYHLSTVDVLAPDQIRRYNELRGYAGGKDDKRHDQSPRH